MEKCDCQNRLNDGLNSIKLRASEAKRKGEDFDGFAEMLTIPGFKFGGLLGIVTAICEKCEQCYTKS